MSSDIHFQCFVAYSYLTGLFKTVKGPPAYGRLKRSCEPISCFVTNPSPPGIFAKSGSFVLLRNQLRLDEVILPMSCLLVGLYGLSFFATDLVLRLDIAHSQVVSTMVTMLL